MIEIENDIPVPSKNAKGDRRAKYPLGELEIGQSFFVPTPFGKTSRQLQMSISGSVDYITKKTGRRFTSRALESGVRIWRIA